MATTVRRAPSGGLNVRSSAAGTKVATLNEGDLMYDIPNVATVTKSLNGTSYVWVKVHYYRSNAKPATEGEGWVTTTHATAVSRTVPSISSTFFSNSYLNQYEMLVNARYIYKYLRDNGWSSDAIYATLGNMEAESTINPGVWNNLNDKSGVYGLVQWNPSTNLTDWLDQENRSNTILNQLNRILYEVAHNEQWLKIMKPTMTFTEFTTSTKSCSVLAEYFLRCYERPGTENSETPIRQANANKWATILGYLV
ncbi:phage tail tip lysozyme [uncultured Bacteroides sp.]|uniref:phage tail tip lysozyme n=1 Tax=uncultured Bacteroides sp. TaxID=162156 RepID=UPI002622A7B7|nr:phage tail tip lysozyme [uncultured Bacteroides sp.]